MHNQGSVSSEVRSSSKQALSRPTRTNHTEAPRTPQERTTPYDDGSTSLATTASEGEAPNVIPEQRQHTQSQASHTTPSSGPKLPSSHVAVTQGTQTSAGGLGYSSQTQSLPARVNITVHRSASVPSPEEAQKTKSQKPDGRGGFPVQVPMPPHACADNRIAKPALEDAPTEKCPASCITSGSITNLPQSHTPPSSRGGQGYPAQHQIHTTATGGKQDRTPRPANPPISNHNAVSKVKSSFTAINSNGRPNVSAPVLVPASQVSVVGIAGIAHDATSRQNSVQSSKSNVRARDTAMVTRAPATSDITKTLHTNIEMPNWQLGPDSGPSPHQIPDGSPAEEKQSITASTQNAKPGQSIVMLVEDWRDLPSARSIDQTQQTAKVDATSTSDKPEKSRQTTHVESNHEDHSALELGKLVKKARDARVRRQNWANDVKVF